MFRRQWQHLILLAALLAAVFALLTDGVHQGEFLGVGSDVWLALAIAVPIVHQIYVWLAWRAELHYAFVSRWLGAQRGFHYYAVGFAILILLRPVTIILLAIANRNTLPINPALAYTSAIILLAPSLYLFYSVARYFGAKRAFGIDHFDPAYRTKPFVHGGIFRYTTNGMYLYGFLILWVPALLWLSQAALLAALFNHLYIWVHYYCTELPDIQVIYGDATD